MTEARKHMQKVLESTGLYDFSLGTILQSEMSAYEVGFSLVEEEIQKLLEDLFIESASAETVEEKELAFRYVPSSESLAVKRQMLLARYGDFAENSNFTRFQKLLLAAGVDAVIAENVKENKLVVTINRLLGISLEQAKKELLTLLPAHLDIEIK
ncbi:hypothetical protein [Scatolibacter rhodanostii]|uniref:hypothetical protein n=1 Tax=Scatolibacter rhodanostii TaxID=2014781 RepID=UPI000C07AD94|nr:hypothetical protein [Scatolibacter rhodanostii]